jgi:hypothetical protein
MFRFLRIAGGIRNVAGVAMLPLLLSGTEATSLPSNTTVSANGISPQDDSVASLGSAAAAFSQPPLALRCWLSHTSDMQIPRTSNHRSERYEACYISLVSYGMPDRQYLVYSVTYDPLLNIEVTVDQTVMED